VVTGASRRISGLSLAARAGLEHGVGDVSRVSFDSVSVGSTIIDSSTMSGSTRWMG